MNAIELLTKIKPHLTNVEYENAQYLLTNDNFQMRVHERTLEIKSETEKITKGLRYLTWSVAIGLCVLAIMMIFLLIDNGGRNQIRVGTPVSIDSHDFADQLDAAGVQWEVKKNIETVTIQLSAANAPQWQPGTGTNYSTVTLKTLPLGLPRPTTKSLE